VRVTAILKGLEGLPIERVATRNFSEEHLTAVHTPALVGYLKAMGQRLDPKAIIYPEVFPIRRPDRVPRALEDRAGYFCADTFTPLTQNSFTAAKDAANVALTAATLVANGERFAYALCRPPGHHAERRIYGGFCFLNNSAIAANYLSHQGKVALLDIDYHHGNGGQDIFYARDDVLTVSIHGHPSHAYPNFSGYSDERGEGPGLGFNHNFPTEPPVDDERYLALLERALGVVRAFKPRFLVLSIGFDIMRGDPTGSFAVTNQGMQRIGKRIGRFGLPTLIVQEGGYSLGNLRSGSHAFFRGLAEAWHV
jgi:acetoin utilization deacetylase AcuC-like enzyme